MAWVLSSGVWRDCLVLHACWAPLRLGRRAVRDRHLDVRPVLHMLACVPRCMRGDGEGGDVPRGRDGQQAPEDQPRSKRHHAQNEAAPHARVRVNALRIRPEPRKALQSERLVWIHVSFAPVYAMCTGPCIASSVITRKTKVTVFRDTHKLANDNPKGVCKIRNRLLSNIFCLGDNNTSLRITQYPERGHCRDRAMRKRTNRYSVDSHRTHACPLLLHEVIDPRHRLQSL